MKRSNLFLGASAFILAIAGAFATKASMSDNHKLTVATKSSGDCKTYLQAPGLTKLTTPLATFITNSRQGYTAGCINTLFRRSDN